MIKPTLAVPLAACLLAMACAQAIAAPNPYSNFIVFGDSLSDAGQFTDTGGPAGATQRYTNRTGPVYFDGSGEVYSANSTQLLGGKLGFSRRTRRLPRPRPRAPARACLMATTGRSAAIAPTRSSIRSPRHPPRANAPVLVTWPPTTCVPTRTRCITSPVAVTISSRAACSIRLRPARRQIDWQTAPRFCRPPAPGTSWSGCCLTWV